MTERERMISGKLYNPYKISDNPWAEIRAACKIFNESDFWSDSNALNELKEHFAKAGEDMVLMGNIEVKSCRKSKSKLDRTTDPFSADHNFLLKNREKPSTHTQTSRKANIT